jgi:hypothetical protein
MAVHISYYNSRCICIAFQDLDEQFIGTQPKSNK